jgi:L-alanine-DL-glutamate epimerase-like enolase superfamily enzyme
MAAWDLFGQMKGKKLYQLWNTAWENTPVTDYTIGIDSIDTMLSKMKEQPWPIYKVKLGTDQDIPIIKALRSATDAVLRVDANAGWTLEEAQEKIPQLAELGVEMIEQPLAKDNWEGMKQLFQESPLPLFADESCVFEQDVLRCANHFHGINIKLTKCSGLTPARRMILKGRELGMKIMMGSMNESSIGAAAVANFLPQLDFVDMDGPLLLSQDMATGIRFDNGAVTLEGSAGLGVRVQF